MPGRAGAGLHHPPTVPRALPAFWEEKQGVCTTQCFYSAACISWYGIQQTAWLCRGMGKEKMNVLTKECCFSSVQPVGSQVLRNHFLHPCWRALFLSCFVLTYSYRVPSFLRSQIVGMLTPKLELMLISLPINLFFKWGCKSGMWSLLPFIFLFCLFCCCLKKRLCENTCLVAN